MSLARKRSYSARRVVTAPYFPDASGRMRPDRPSSCPFSSPPRPCVIGWHGHRSRKCGPGYALALCACEVHALVFTVYPPAWMPYGRRPIVDVDPSGSDVVGNTVDAAWSRTAFGASLDAAAGRIWPLTHADDGAWRERYGALPYGVARTQQRHVAGVGALLCLPRELETARAAVVAALGVALADLVAAAGRVRDGPPIVAEGVRGAAILSALGRPSRRLLAGFVRLGVDREYWGPPTST